MIYVHVHALTHAVPDMADITLQEEVLFDVYGNARILVEIQVLRLKLAHLDARTY